MQRRHYIGAVAIATKGITSLGRRTIAGRLGAVVGRLLVLRRLAIVHTPSLRYRGLVVCVRIVRRLTSTVVTLSRWLRLLRSIRVIHGIAARLLRV
jgi:hypothetical protein